MEKLDIANIEKNLKSLLNHKSYNAFSASQDSYKYAEIINKYASFCLYCNMESIITHRRGRNKKGDRLRFDHFIRKVDTANVLNPYNLIPCCHKCNSDYKGSQDVDSMILNPLKESFNELAEFYISVKPEEIGKFNKYEFCIKITTKNKKLQQKTKNTIKIFNLANRYNGKDTKSDLTPFMNILFNTTSFKFDDYKKLSGCDKDSICKIFGVPYKNINKERYGKLKNDLVKKYLGIN